MIEPITHILLDLDNSIITGASFPLLCKAAGVNKEMIDALRQKYRHDPKKELEWGRKMAATLRGRTVEELQESLGALPFKPGVYDFFTDVDKRIEMTGIISSGIDVVAERVRQELGINFSIANELVVKDGLVTGDFTLACSMYKKFEVFTALALEKELKLKNTLYVGDNFNDEQIMRFIKMNGGHTAAFDPKKHPALMEIAHLTFYDYRELGDYIANVNDKLATREYTRLVEVVGVFFTDTAGRLCVVKEGKHEREGIWNIPGGRLEPGEQFHEAAVRETRSETGIDVIVTGIVGQYRIAGHRGDELVKYNVRASINGSLEQYDVKPANPTEILDILFVDVNELIEKNPLNMPDYIIAQIKDYRDRKHAPLELIGKRLIRKSLLY